MQQSATRLCKVLLVSAALVCGSHINAEPIRSEQSSPMALSFTENVSVRELAEYHPCDDLRSCEQLQHIERTLDVGWYSDAQGSLHELLSSYLKPKTMLASAQTFEAHSDWAAAFHSDFDPALLQRKGISRTWRDQQYF